MAQVFRRQWWQKLLGHSSPRISRQGSRPPRAVRPAVEILEERTLLTAGILDPTFGVGGVVITTPANGTDGITGLVLQPDGKLIAAGNAGPNLLLARYDADGAPDPTFGSGGQVNADVGLSASDYLRFDQFHLALQTDGKIIVSGNTGHLENNTNAMLVERFLPAGTLDPTFGTGGKATIGPGLESNGVALQADGKIVVAGDGTGALVVARLNANGTIDTTFGTNGRAIASLSSDNAASFPLGVGIEPNGRIVVLTHFGVVLNNKGETAPNHLVGFTAAGILDAGFGAGGITAIPVANSVHGLTVLPDGRLLLAEDPILPEFGLLRYFANGVLDASFGGYGETTTVFIPFQIALAVAVQPDGRYVAAGIAIDTSVHPVAFGFALARYNPNGSLDTTFGNFGGGAVAPTQDGPEAHQVLVQPDGRVVAAGNLAGTLGFGGKAFLLARYTGDTPLPTANQRFVAQAYLDLLGRPVDGAGLAQWSNRLDQGSSRTQVVLDIQSSPEFARHTVNALYSRYLHRFADPIGLADSVSFLRSGGTVERLIDVLVSSPEFLQGQGKGTRDGFLDALYQDALDRAVDPGGRAAWSQALAGGISYAAVAAAILAGPEYRQDLVTEAYEFFLRRPPDTAGLNGFTTLLGQGESDAQVLAMMVGSPEYFRRI